MDLEKEVLALQARNRKVEGDKAWETSLIRRLTITVATYILAGVWLVLIHDTFPWLKAFVPSLGYLFFDRIFVYDKKTLAGTYLT